MTQGKESRKISNGKRFLLIGGILLVTALFFTFSPISSPQAHADVSIGCPPTQDPGANNDWVKVIQYRLDGLMQNDVFYYSGGFLSPDGGFGNATYNAVVAFQRANRLQANGEVGPMTWSMLSLCNVGSAHVPSGNTYGGTNCPPSEYDGDNNTFVDAAQHMINMAAYYKVISTTSPRSGWYPLSQDGDFGGHTLSGVYDFQAGNAPISVDGNIGPQTWGAMGMCFG